MKYFKCLVICLLFGKITAAQEFLPSIDRVEVDSKHYFQTYVPKGLFLERFPNFLIDGKYSYDRSFPDFVICPKFSYFDIPFTNKEFPCEIVHSANRFKRPVKILLRNHYGTESGRDNIRATDLDAFAETLVKKGLTKVYIDNILSNTQKPILQDESIEFIIDLHPIITNASHGEAFMIDYNEGMAKSDYKKFVRGELFPKFFLYQMDIRNIAGDIIKSYQQAIFIDARNYNGWHTGKTTSLKDSMSTVVFNIASNSLVNKFLNDTRIINNIDSFRTLPNLTYIKNSDTRSIVSRYGILKYQKLLLQIECAELKTDFNTLTKYIDARADNKTIFIGSIMNSDEVNNASAAATQLASNVIYAIYDAQDAKANRKALQKLKAAIAMFDQTTQQLIDDVALLPPSKEKEDLILKLKAENNSLEQGLNEAVAAQNEVLKHKSQNDKNTAAELVNISNAMDKSQNLTSRPEGIAISNSNTPGNQTGDNEAQKKCADEATAIWKRSSEYQRYLHTGLSSDYKYSDAKLIDIMVEHCGSLLQSDEVSKLRQISTQTKEEAKQIGSGGKYQK